MADAEKKKKPKAKKEAAGDAAAPASDSGGSTKASGGSSKKAKRAGSSVFSMFSQRQVQEFKEAFGFIDADKDGLIGKNDLRASFDALGRLVGEKELEEMLAEASGPINFTMFLTIFGDRISGVDDEDTIMNAFAQYDDGNGKCSAAKLKHDLMQWGERFKQQEVDDAFESAPVEGDLLDLKKFCAVLTKGAEDEEGG